MFKFTKEFIFTDHLSKRQAEHMGAVYNDKQEAWRLPNTLGVLGELYQLTKNYEVECHGKKKKLKRASMMCLRKLEDTPGDERLRPYQRVDVNYLKRLPHAGVFNEMRTGKTPTSLVLMNEIMPEGLIIVCPASLVINWSEEIERWTHHFEALPVKGDKKKRRKIYDEFETNMWKALVISYETLRNDIDILREHAGDNLAIIVDEAHRLRNFNPMPGKGSQSSKAVMKLGKLAKHRYALTGTPTVKDGYEIWPILHFLYPERFPGRWQFLDRYFEVMEGVHGKEIGGYKRSKELQDILALISTNRKRKEVMPWLPDKTYQTIALELTGKQKKAYKDVERIFEYEEDDQLLIDCPTPLAQITRLRQLTTGPEVLDIKDAGAKEKFILEWLDDHPNEPVIIFSRFTSYLKRLSKKLKERHGVIHGDITKSDRDTTAKHFQAGKIRILLANITAAGTGLTLDAGETVIFIDKEWNPADNQQAEDRIVSTRSESISKSHIITLVLKDTYDEVLEKVLEAKHDITSVINDGGIKRLKEVVE